MLIPRTVKKAALGSAVALTAGTLLFGGEIVSYAKTSLYAVQREAKAAVPLAFELQRARDLLDDVLPELHENIRRIAREEVELESLNRSIADSEQRVAREEAALTRLRDQVAASADDPTARHQATATDLARRARLFKEAQLVLEGKRRVEESRRASLAAATASLEGVQSRKTQLEDQIEGLAAQFSLVQAAASTSDLAVHDSKLAQTETLITDLRDRLDVAQRTLAHEARFVAHTRLTPPTDAELLAEVDALLGESSPATDTLVQR